MLRTSTGKQSAKYANKLSLFDVANETNVKKAFPFVRKAFDSGDFMEIKELFTVQKTEPLGESEDGELPSSMS